jgi:hypothetical protein
MTNLVGAYQKKEINEFERILRGKLINAIMRGVTIVNLHISESSIHHGRPFHSNLY